jgi:hypothetical protein
MNEKALPAYAELMAEIKLRTEAIDAVLAGNVSLRAKIAEELCYLQLRMICETIAIGCLLVHGDISAKKSDLMKSYKADWIIKQLTELHSRFYPNPLEDKDDIDADGRFLWKNRKESYLGKSELLQLYTRIAGGHLHRGSAKNALKRDRPLEFKEIRDWRDKIVRLLNRHTLLSADQEQIFYVAMNSGGTEQVAWNIFQAVGASSDV